MSRPACRITIVILAILAVAACPGCEASGNLERVSHHRLAPQPPDAVERSFDDNAAKRPHHVLAHVEARAGTRRFATVAEAEAAALDKLRELAGRAGARAVINIEQTIRTDDDRGEQIVFITGTAVVFRR